MTVDECGLSAEVGISLETFAAVLQESPEELDKLGKGICYGLLQEICELRELPWQYYSLRNCFRRRSERRDIYYGDCGWHEICPLELDTDAFAFFQAWNAVVKLVWEIEHREQASFSDGQWVADSNHLYCELRNYDTNGNLLAPWAATGTVLKIGDSSPECAYVKAVLIGEMALRGWLPEDEIQFY